MIMTYIAKPVVKNKFWIVEEDGAKVATIQAIDEGGFAYVHDNQREVFPSIKVLTSKYNIQIVKPEKKQTATVAYDVYGYPTSGKPHNEVLDVQRYLPIYTKATNSKSFYCAGHYLVKYSSTWVHEYCPKIITLNRHEYQGPFKTKERATDWLKEEHGS
jgi:hypothetical protein